MAGECSTCTQLWRLYAQAADDLWKTGAALQTAGLSFDHTAIQGGIKGLRQAARERDRVEREIVLHEFQAHAGGSESAVAELAPLRLADVERAHIELIVSETKGNLSKASRILDIDRSTLYTKLRSYGLK
jgi:DNA-binding protein Fis